mmetsp:Transcript_50161/g.121543  ORF Transcript_50161/g.121543 Transcript_50161/m.121543 type:complete len:512 (+) Transcript_50161:229-1764(+)
MMFRASAMATFAVTVGVATTTPMFTDKQNVGVMAFTSLTLPKTHPSKVLKSSSFDDDELSKLIGKRNQIKRKKKEEIVNEDAIFDATLSKAVDKGEAATADDVNPEDILSSIDVDNYNPQLETKRPVRKPKKKDDDGKKKDETVSNEPTYIDFTAEYDDENDFHVPNRIGITTKCWGDENEGFVASGKLKKQQIREGKFVPGDIQLAFNELLNEGIVLFETSPSYGKSNAGKQLSAHDILARCMKEYQETSPTVPLIVDTFPNKFFQRTAGSVTKSINDSCEKLGVPAVDVSQVQSMGWLPSGGILNGMSESIIDQGTANYVGVRNVSPLRMRRLQTKLDKLDLSLTTNSFDFSLVNRRSEKLLDTCKLLGVVPLISNPLGSGLASGQYTASNPSGGVAGAKSKFSFDTLEKLQPLHSTLDSVAERVKTRLRREVRDIQDRQRGRYGPTPKINTDITTTQIALNYVVTKGGVPLVEVNNPKQAQEVIGCLGWTLTDAEVDMLELAADACRS